MKQNATIRKLLAPLEKTPFHPQWFVFKDKRGGLKQIGQHARGYVLDIGAGKQEIRHMLSSDCHYISLDYYETAAGWYGTKPQVFGDGQVLPIQAQSVDTVLLLDVLEHLPDPMACINDVYRVLRPGGKFIIQAPFLYPLHDAPYDFRRWTLFGLRELARRGQFKIEVETSLGHPLESAALLSNLALSKTIINWMQQKNPFLLFLFILPWIVLSTNLRAWILTCFSREEKFMPAGYRMVWIKPS